MVPCSVVELRQYTLHPGRRAELIDLFERELVEPQEAAAIRVLGHFEDTGRPDLFVWFRGFAGMPARREALEAFYGGPVWRAHREAANATMVDSDDVLLLRPLRPAGAFPERAGPAEARLLLRVLHRAPGATDLATFFLERVRPVLEGTGGPPLAVLETEHAANDFPRLPVREDADVLVCLSAFADAAALARHLALLSADLHWAEDVGPALRARLRTDVEERVLRPAPRSRLR